MKGDTALRKDLRNLLGGRGAHVEFTRAVAGLAATLRGTKPREMPYTPWQQVEHLRFCQWDILEYIRNPRYAAPRPEEYWPEAAPPTRDAWDTSIKAFQADLRAVGRLVADPKTDLLARVPHDPKGPTILHEILLIADHNAYHLGQLIVLRRMLGAWRD